MIFLATGPWESVGSFPASFYKVSAISGERLKPKTKAEKKEGEGRERQRQRQSDRQRDFIYRLRGKL